MDPARRQRVDHFIRKLSGLSRFETLKEYVRYERAKNGSLPHAMPPEFVDDTLIALRELLRRKHKLKGTRLKRRLDVLRNYPSKPFL